MEQLEATTARPQPLPLDEERELVGLSRQGDLKAFDRLVGALQDGVYGLAYRLMGNYDDANDLAQEVFLTCFRKIAQFRGDCRLKTWLYRITVNLAKNAWKKRDRRGEAATFSLDDAGDDGESERWFEPASTAADPRRVAVGTQTASALWSALEELSDEHREAIVLRGIEDLSYHEIAEVTECSLGTVKSRINRARTQLRELMKDHL